MLYIFNMTCSMGTIMSNIFYIHFLFPVLSQRNILRQGSWREIGQMAQSGTDSSSLITYDDFQKVDIRAGTIVKAEPFPEARRPAIKLWVDFGEPIGIRKSSAQITAYYQADSLIGRQVVAVTNFPPRQIGKFMSEVLVLGVPSDTGEVVLLSPDQPVPNGGRMY